MHKIHFKMFMSIRDGDKLNNDNKLFNTEVVTKNKKQ